MTSRSITSTVFASTACDLDSYISDSFTEQLIISAESSVEQGVGSQQPVLIIL